MRRFVVFLALLPALVVFGCGDMNNPIQPSPSTVSTTTLLDGDDSKGDEEEGTITLNEGVNLQPAGGFVNPLASLPGLHGQGDSEDGGEILPTRVLDPADDNSPLPDGVTDDGDVGISNDVAGPVDSGDSDDSLPEPTVVNDGADSDVSTDDDPSDDSDDKFFADGVVD